MNDTNKIYDLAIIGAGIIGASLARLLSQYELSICVLEKENDVSCGTSKANSGIIHAGYDAWPGTKMAKLNVSGNALYEALSKELGFDFQKIGSYVVAQNEDELKSLEALLDRGEKNKVPNLAIVSKDVFLKKEIYANPDIQAALWAPTAAIISPYEATWAFAENAAENGVSFLFDTEVHGIEKQGKTFSIKTGRGIIQSRFLVNAAGLFSDRINKMIGAKAFVIKPRRGEYILLDTNMKHIAKSVLFQPPSSEGKGVLISPTVDGNILIGPTADPVSDKRLMDTTEEGQKQILEIARKTIPDLSKRYAINSFSGLRASPFIIEDQTEKQYADFIIEEDETIQGFICLGGIASPGLAAAPAIAEAARDLLYNAGLELKEKNNFQKYRKAFVSFALSSDEEKKALVEKNPLYARIICRCEMVTEAEIVQAIHSLLGAKDLDGVKRRTRAQMGRCQGGFCLPRITEILSRERNLLMTEVTKSGKSSFVLDSKSREALS